MEWVKKGLIFKPDGQYEWSLSHAQVPFAEKIDNDILRIYFGTRDEFNRTVTTYIEVSAEDPQDVLYVHNQPVLNLGELGCFDDSGAMPSWIVNYEGEKYLYYTGWNVSQTVSYRLSIGLAVSADGGKSFRRLHTGPIMDRSITEPHWCAQPCVLLEDGKWRMWYLSCTKWEIIDGKTEPFYLIKYAESTDGIHWRKLDHVCIDYDPATDAIGRPSVLLDDGMYKMFYSYRKARDYRTDPRQSYKLGYAESTDGVNWTRRDGILGLSVSDGGWDRVMTAYPYVYEHKGKKHILYNGNGFGRSGFGYAVQSEEQDS